MDDPDCDPAALDRTYRAFRTVNALVAGWRAVYRRSLRPLLSPTEPRSLLDIGSGGGDVPRAIARWAARDGLLLDITAIDPDERAHAFATRQTPVPGVTFRRASSADLVAEGRRFDLVTSNHLLHHLSPAELDALLADCEALCAGRVVHSDIARSRLAYALYSAATWPVARGTFLHYDGRMSIRRSYTAPELNAVVPPTWAAIPMFPFRTILVHPAAQRA